MSALLLATAFALPALAAAQAPSLDLQHALDAAFRNRPAIRAAEQKVKSALANQSALSAPPATRLEAGYGTSPDLGIGNDLLFAQPIDIFGKTRASRDTGKAGVLAARAALRQEELDLQTEVLNAYAEALSAQELVQTGQELADLSAQEYDSTKKRIDAGDLPPAQLLRADLELQRAKQTLELRRHTLEAARTRLASALGVPPASVGDLASAVPTPSPAPPLVERPDLAQIRSEFASARADAASAAASRWPDMELQFARDYWDNPERYVGRVQFVVPLFDFGAARQKIKSAQASEASASASLRDKSEQARHEVEAARLEFEGAMQASQGFERLIQDARNILEKQQRAFAAGAASLLDILDASRALRETEESAIDAKTQWIQAEGRYLAASGSLLINR